MSDNELSRKSEIDHLKELILNSGLPLEIEIVSYLANRSSLMSGLDEISTSTHYLDKDEGKGRELDINMKIGVSSEKKTSPMVFLNLLIECKKILGNAWIFFKSPHKLEPTYKCTSILDALNWAPKEHVNFIYLDGLHFRKLPITNMYKEFILNEKQSNKLINNLFGAATELAKATNYELETFVSQTRRMLDGWTMQTWKEEEPYEEYVDIFYPVIVFDGAMYTAEEVEKGKNMTLNPTDHVDLLHNYVSGNYNVELTIDVVHRKAFERFVKMLIEDIEIWKKALDGDAGRKFKKEVSKAGKWYFNKRKRARRAS